jgi:hypothetical protein
MATKAQALAALGEGKRVTRATWPDGSYLITCACCLSVMKRTEGKSKPDVYVSRPACHENRSCAVDDMITEDGWMIIESPALSYECEAW